jgi:hypothetical protein
MNQYSFSIPVCSSCRPISSLQLEATVKKSRYVAVSALTLASVLCGGFAVAADKPLMGVYLLLFAPPKTMAGPSVSGITSSGATLSATINKNGTGYYLVRPALEAAPTVAEVFVGTSFAMNANVAATANVAGLNATTAYKLYFVAKSTSNKAQAAVQSAAFTTSSGGPGVDDCHGDAGGTAALDNCGICVGGNTGRVSVCRMINDTGLTWGGNYPSGNNVDCTGEEIDAQDCSNGADADPSLNDDADGHAGFSFTKISNSGAELPSTATLGNGANEWACTRDNVTGLIWEVKTNDGGLHDQNDSYTWYNTDPATNGGAVGYDDDSGASCEGYVAGQSVTYCNTEAYTARVNNASWCGHTDWRMPTRKELQGIVSFDRVSPAIDTGYFPNTPASSVVWSGSPVAYHSNYAWLVVFDFGDSYIVYRSNSYQVRLVRGGQ